MLKDAIFRRSGCNQGATVPDFLYVSLYSQYLIAALATVARHSKIPAKLYTAFMLPLNLSFSVLRVSLRALENVHLPPFYGSKLEGAFGRSLYALACVQTHRETCVGCSLHLQCPYGLTYAPLLPPEVEASSLGMPPRPVVFRVAYGHDQYLVADDRLTFGFVVIGKALTQLPFLLAALRDVGKLGLGRMGGRLELDEVVSIHPYTGEEIILMNGIESSVQLTPITLCSQDLPPIASSRVRLSLQSPLHLKQNGQMSTNIQFPLLIRSLQRRMSNLEQVHGGQQSIGAHFGLLPELAQSVATTYQYWQPVSQLRKGHRPYFKTSMQGLIGTVEYAGEFSPFSVLLRLGEQLGVGKWAHFGAGLYDIDIDSDNNLAGGSRL